MVSISSSIFVKGTEHFLEVLFVEGRKAYPGVCGHFTPEVLVEDQVVLGFEEKGLQLIFYKMLLGDLDGVFLAGEHAHRVIAHDDLLPLIAKGDEVGAFHIVDPVYSQVDCRNQNDYVVFGDWGFRTIQPGNKDQHYNDQCKDGGHCQSAQPDPVGVFLVIYFHVFSFGAPS